MIITIIIIVNTCIYIYIYIYTLYYRTGPLWTSAAPAAPATGMSLITIKTTICPM